MSKISEADLTQFIRQIQIEFSEEFNKIADPLFRDFRSYVGRIRGMVFLEAEADSLPRKIIAKFMYIIKQKLND